MDSSMSRKSDAAATRKRRSSILKSQRAPRTPFSELEFHVATPTDVAKSRRVSFSRRNGVAEFEITEATTAWKNVYEEHNKSLETSGNDASEKSERDTGRRVEYVGCRITDVEFEDVDPGQDPLITSYNEANAEYTNNDKSLLAPHMNFELTEFTEHQTNQLFDNDTNPMIREITDQIDINFSAVAPLSDELEIHEDLDQDRKASNMSCIDIDLNATHFSLNAEESDMSITDSIHSPKVAAAKMALEDRKSNADDWVADKENMIVNPYVAPLPAENFAVSDDNNDVLVFDGKKCKFQSDISNKTLPNENAAVKLENSNKRRTIVYNNDQGDISVTQGVNAQIIAAQENIPVSRKSINKTRINDSNISMTQAVAGNILMSAQEKVKAEKERTIHFDDFADISVTQALPSNIFSQKLDERRKTVYENDEGHLSMTEMVPANVIPAVAELKKTILYENEDADISMTQAVPLNIQVEEPSERRKTVVDEDDAVDETLAVSTNVINPKRKTILFGNDTGNISMTQAIPDNLILSEKKESDKRKTIVYEDEGGNISVTQAVPANLILPEKTHSDKRITIVDENDDGDMSVTEMVPNKVVLEEIQDRLQILQDKSVVDMSLAQIPPTNLENTEATNKQRTIVFNDSQGNLSITQSLPENILVPAQVAEKRKTIIYRDEAADISVTQAVPVNFIQKYKDEYDISSNKIESKEDVFETKHEGYSSMVQSNPNEVKIEKSRKSDGCDADEDVNMSITQAIPKLDITSNRNTTIPDEKLGNMSMSKPIPAEIMSIQSDLEEKSKTKEIKLEETYVATNKSIIEPQDILIYEAAIKYTKTEEDNESDLATGSDDVLESSSSKMSESASDSTVSVTSGKIEVVGDLKEDYDTDMKPLVDGENNTSAISVIENRMNSSTKHVKIKDVSVKESILNDLLDMSDSGHDDPRDNKNLMIKLTSDASTMSSTVTNERGSQESYLLIKDSDEDRADKKSGTSSEEIPALECPKLLPIEYQEEKHHGLVGKLQHKLSELKTFINQKNSSKTKNVTLKSLDPEKVDELDEIENNETMDQSKCKPSNKTENIADDTNALLDMLSHFTDTRVSRDFTAADDKEASPLKIKGLIAIENKPEVNDTRRSLVPDRKSMIRSREDLLKDISMAQAMMKFDDELEDQQMDETAEDTVIETQEEPSPPRRSPRLGHDVVKTLKFDEDDSMLDAEISSRQETRSTRHEMATSPLKKTAFGETTYIEDHIRDSKTKVIPGFLKDVSNDLKELMSELVKPINDPIPFETNIAKKSTSTHSTQIQANLLTSSQIDLDPELQSNAHSAHSMEERLASEMAAVDNKNIARALKSQIISPESHLKIPELESEPSTDPKRHSERRSIRKVQDPSRVIVFDHQNPLNNVLLPAIDQSEVHKYNPGVSESAESLGPETSEATPECEPEQEEQHVVESRVALHDNVRPAGDSGPPAIAKQSFMSDTSKPMSLDESIDAKQEVKEVEVNTVIVMKGNRDLLEASSSLTLVDDALARSAYDVEIDSNSPQKKSRSPVQVIFKIKEPESSVKLDSDLTSNDDDMSLVQGKGKKRNYSPAQPDKHCTFASEEVTPKPASKVQKVSLIAKTKKMLGISPKQHDRAAQADAESSQDESSSAESDAPSEELEKSKRKPKLSSAAITVQQLITEYDMDAQIDQAALNREILAHLTAKAAKSEASCSTIEPVTLSNTEDCKSLEVSSSFASSRRNFQSDPSECEGLNSVSSETRRAQWQPELMHEISSKNLITECESSINVVSKIDVLPFMGTTDCEWESRSADCWTFRLLRARLRLIVRLRHRHGNAPRSRVRADTPVAMLAVEQPLLEHKKENPIATLCVKFAEEAIRYFCGRGCTRAGSVPALLRRCAGAARVAVRWGRAMHAARAHLAFTLTHDGALSLKVANIPLRSVWEVTMQIELVVNDAREAPWPLAGCVRVSRVVAEATVSEAELRRLLATVPRDWGHAPRAVWKIFKYLKRKTRDDELLFGL